MKERGPGLGRHWAIPKVALELTSVTLSGSALTDPTHCAMNQCGAARRCGLGTCTRGCLGS